MADWDPSRVKAQLRLTAQKLGQLQDKLESQDRITQRDIATLLQQRRIALARAKAQKLTSNDNMSDLLQTLEMHVGVILGHMHEFEHGMPLSPMSLEAVSSIIVAAPHVDAKELRVVKDILAHRLQSEVLKSLGDYVPEKVRSALTAYPPSAARLDYLLFSIAKTYQVDWKPDLPPDEKVNAISEMLDPSTMHDVDLPRLRMLCSHGLPEDPPWLRPKVWRLLLGTLPLVKAAWTEQNRKNRENYYDLIRRLLEPFSALSAPTTPLAPLDASLLEASQELTQVPLKLIIRLRETPEAFSLCPLDETAADEIRISCAQNLDVRLNVIRELESKEALSHSTPEIRLESTPEIRLENADDESTTLERFDRPDASSASSPIPPSPSSAQSGASTTLLPSRTIGAHPKHASALLRLLFVHARLNPGNDSPHIASLLVPVYTALLEEVNPEDAAHVEADTFWAFEAFVAEISDLNDPEGSDLWTRRFSERLNWADPELADDLQSKGLDPALPHYSFRWLVPLLTHTLPLSCVLMAWDALFSQPMRQRDTNPKLDYLLDVCTGMLLRTKGILLRLGKPVHRAQDLWSAEVTAMPSTSLGVRELQDAFVEGMAFLQQYPVEAAGGIEAILQCAHDLSLQREVEKNSNQGIGSGLGARLRKTVWKGITHQPPISESHLEDEEDEGRSHRHVVSTSNNGSPARHARKASGFTARLADTVWRGISNESAMEAPPSPPTPESPLQPSPAASPRALPEVSLNDASTTESPSLNRSKLWDYAEKFKESDTAAKLSKVSTNWKVKAMDAWNKGGSSASSKFLSPSSSPHSSVDMGGRRTSLPQDPSPSMSPEKRRGSSLSGFERSDAYSPPPRPTFFRPPIDSVLFSEGRSPISLSNGEASPSSEPSSAGSAGLRASLASLTKSDRGKPARSKAGPRPLLLSSSSLITSGRSPTLPSSVDRAWVDNVRARRPSPTHRDSLSSVSSVADPYMRSRNSSAMDSDTTSSRIVPLRASRSPMAGSRRVTPTSSTTSSPPRLHRRRDTETSTQFGSDDGSRGWNRVDMPESPPTGPSPPPPRTPDAASVMQTDVRVQVPEPHRGSLAFSETSSDASASDPKASIRAQVFPHLSVEGDTSDSSATQAAPPSPRTTIKRLPPRLNNPRTRDNQGSLTADRLEELDNATTPRAMTFPTNSTSPRPQRRVRKTSATSNGEARPRKLSGEGRIRKMSSDGHSIRSRKLSGEREAAKHKRDSSAVEGDDEGYNDLLSAYESEDNVL
ncbi:uncharacterized protein LAESUDRAFT_720468 [Laetiporus sulphureus 93-53]|uniref:Rab-GAP TBC domain-containing protein n=1 Tax=Laetiporus sulphureus 93-53 TaxID=1314785 RepID=A0A165H5A5_9APHY|nr:uncharacterized protein LAESUDRAFT_720468 [Laetiporus sulphureus 93-53]KZT11262.1 hypothetical protein LAESUDRAFT_720468 [Laetiporus sulphureus 93-53]